MKSFLSISLKRLPKILLLLFCWTILPLFMVEVLMIMLEPYLFKGLYQYDQELGFKIRSYANGNNQFGFNDRDYSLERSPDSFRMLIVSDSFNWAGGKEGNYTTLLENKFEQVYGKSKVEVINTGYPGTHTGEQLAMLKKYGLQYNPDFVLLGFFTGNDFLDADPNRKRIIVNDIYIDIDRDKELVIFGYPIIGQSRLLLFIQQKYKIFREAATSKQAVLYNNPIHPPLTKERTKVGLKTLIKNNSALPYNFAPLATLPVNLPPQPQEKSPGILSLDTFLETEKNRLEFCKIEDLKKGKQDKQINYILDSINEMNSILKSKNIQFKVAIYPDEFQVNPQLLNQVAQKFDLNLQNYEVNCMQRILKTHLKQQGIFYIDFLERFQTEQKSRPLYLVQEPHWNSVGNQLAADILFQELQGTLNSFFSQHSPKPSFTQKGENSNASSN